MNTYYQLEIQSSIKAMHALPLIENKPKRKYLKEWYSNGFRSNENIETYQFLDK